MSQFYILRLGGFVLFVDFVIGDGIVVEPTEEQERWVWEQCSHECVHAWDKTLVEGIKPDCYDCVCNKCGMKFTFATGRFFAWGHEYDFPSIDLNNLFKYPPCRMSTILWRKIIREWASTLTGDYKKDTLALFWAIYKALGGKK